MEIIPSKAAMSLTSQNWKWLHEESWGEKHQIFASKCSCFSNVGPQKFSWTSQGGGKGHPLAQHTGYLLSGRWILEEQGSERLLMAAQLQWEVGIFERAWISVSLVDTTASFTAELQPLNWLLVALMYRLAPDQMILSGDIPTSISQSFTTREVVCPTGNLLNSFAHTLVEIDLESWEAFRFTAKAREELSWVRKRVEREKRDIERLSRPVKRPFLIRLLTALSPMRRRGRSPMIHPLTKYRQRL